MSRLHDNIRYMKGVGEKRAAALEKLGITTLRDALAFFPRAYEDRRKFFTIAEAPLDTPVCVKAMVAAAPTASFVRRGMELLKLRAVDETGALDITYFNQNYLKNTLQPGVTYVFYGRVNEAGRRRTMTNPAFEREDAQGLVTGRILPLYHLTAGVNQKFVMGVIRQALDACGGDVPDILPPALREKYSLAQARFAYENIHFPRDDLALDQARQRMVFEELYVLAGALELLRSHRKEAPGIPFASLSLEEFWKALPFSPTNAQRRAAEEAAREGYIQPEDVRRLIAFRDNPSDESWRTL